MGEFVKRPDGETLSSHDIPSRASHHKHPHTHTHVAAHTHIQKCTNGRRVLISIHSHMLQTIHLSCCQFTGLTGNRRKLYSKGSRSCVRIPACVRTPLWTRGTVQERPGNMSCSVFVDGIVAAWSRDFLSVLVESCFASLLCLCECVDEAAQPLTQATRPHPLAQNVPCHSIVSAR